MDYGINNSRGKVPTEEVLQILQSASDKGVTTLDTARAYGDSESVLGSCIPKISKPFKIISKLPRCSASEVEQHVQGSLKILGASSLYGYLLHDFKAYLQDPKIWDKLLALKQKKIIENAGFSLYYPKELELLLTNHVPFDMIQIPYSIFDRRFEMYLPVLKQKKVKMYARSVFLQGLAFKDPDTLSGHFDPIKPKLKLLKESAKKSSASPLALCLGFVLNNPMIDGAVVGVDSFKQFQEILSMAEARVPKCVDYAGFPVNEEEVLVPSLWKKEAERL
jgi:aryl-alcohol dehydrogenase-like predicted oxidoreductase